MAIVAYITLIGFIIALVMHGDEKNKSALGAFHIRQMLGLILTNVAAGILSFIPFLGWLIGPALVIAVVIFWVLGLISAVNHEMKPLPIVGPYFQEWFRGVG